LYRPPTHEDIDQYSNVQRVLREEIVNPLRTNYFVRCRFDESLFITDKTYKSHDH
jgi:hypothetical protein